MSKWKKKDYFKSRRCNYSSKWENSTKLTHFTFFTLKCISVSFVILWFLGENKSSISDYLTNNFSFIFKKSLFKKISNLDIQEKKILIDCKFNRTKEKRFIKKNRLIKEKKKYSFKISILTCVFDLKRKKFIVIGYIN